MDSNEILFNNKGEMVAKNGQNALDQISFLINKMTTPNINPFEKIDFLKGAPFFTNKNLSRLFEKGCDLNAFSREANKIVADALDCRSLLWKCLKPVEETDISWRQFEIKASCIIKKEENYEATTENLIQELERQEEDALIIILEENLKDDKRIDSKLFDEKAVLNLKDKVSNDGAKLNKIAINRDIISDIVKNMSSVIDPIMERELILSGYVANCGEAQIITSSGCRKGEAIEKGNAYGLSDPEHLGAFGFKEKLQNVLKPNGKNSFIWEWAETIRIKILNPEGIAKWVRNIS